MLDVMITGIDPVYTIIGNDSNIGQLSYPNFLGTDRLTSMFWLPEYAIDE